MIKAVNKIEIKDKNYPEILKKIYSPPKVLYIKGNIDIINNKTIGIVGCRNASEYGKKAAKYFGFELAKKGFNIVSGLARGIDSYAHIGNIQALLENKNTNKYGKPIAVIGNGLDIVYPKENIELEKKILEVGGAIITEYPVGTKPEKMHFPARNRIISGISKGIIIVEAKLKSGALITVDFALDQGKDVYVVPGNINSANSLGTNELIKQGAKIITNVDDIEIWKNNL